MYKIKQKLEDFYVEEIMNLELNGGSLTFSFYDDDGRAGIDDFQDGCGCSDLWVPKEVCGWRAVTLIR